jgi:hypothetical protein
MRKAILIITVLLISINVFGQAAMYVPITAEQREFVAEFMDQTMEKNNIPIDVYCIGDDNKALVLSCKDFKDFSYIYAFLIGFEKEDGLYNTFITLDFDYLCFKEADKCYTYSEMKSILK